LALANYRTRNIARRLVQASPPHLVHVALRAANPALAAELEHVNANPLTAPARIAKLDADTAVELIGYLTDPAVLAAISTEPRVAVRDAVSSRCASLGVKLSGSTPLSQRTRRTLERAENAFEALEKMATVDVDTVAEWLRTASSNDTLLTLLTKGRHSSLRRTAHHLLLELDLVEHVNATDPVLLREVLVNWQQPLNRAAVSALELCVERKYSFQLTPNLGFTPDAANAGAALSPRAKVAIDTASDEEFRDWLDAIDLSDSSGWSQHSEVSHRLQQIRSTRLLPVALEYLGELHGNAANRTAATLLALPGLTAQQRRELLGHRGTDVVYDLRQQGLDADDAAHLAAVLARNADDAREVVRRLGAIPEANGGLLCDHLYELVPGLGDTLVRAGGWPLSRFLSRAADIIGDDAACWAMLFSELSGYSGPPAELALAALAAST
jgi:hypothetical protein